MALNILPKRFHLDFSKPGSKPVGLVEIDWSNPLSKKLLYCFIWQNGQAVDLVRAINVPLSPASFTLDHNIDGSFMDHSGRAEAESSYSPFASTVGTGGVALFTVFRGPTATRQTLISSRVAFNDKHIEIRLNSNAAGGQVNGSTAFFVTGTTIQGVAATSTITGDWQSTLCQRAGSELEIYIDGINKASASITAQDVDGSPTFVFGGLPGTATIQYTGDRSVDMAWNRSLTPAEIKSLDADPYQVLKPLVLPSYFTAAAAARFPLLLPKEYHHDFRTPGVTPKGVVEIDRLSRYSLNILNYFDTNKYADVVTNVPLLSSNPPRKNGAVLLNGFNYLQTPTITTVGAKLSAFIDFTVTSNTFIDSGCSIHGSFAYTSGLLSSRAISSVAEWGLLYTGSLFRVRIQAAGTVFTLDWTVSVSVDDIFKLFLVRDGTSVTLYNDGLQVASTTIGSASAPNSISGAVTFIGNDHNATTSDSGMTVRSFAVWNDSLSPGAVAELTKNTICILKPKNPPVYFVAGDVVAPSGRIMSSLANAGGLAGLGGIAGPGGGLAG